MSKQYYQAYGDVIKDIRERKQKPYLLLHACCGPCSTHVLEELKPYFQITVYYDNDNIHPEAEFRKRWEALKQAVEQVGETIALEKSDYDPKRYFQAVKGFEQDGEHSARCEACIALRLERSAQKAAEIKADYFASTLSVSPHKDVALINKLGEGLAERYGIKHLPNDFKKKEGYKHSIALCKDWSIYRQDYCGCCFSYEERFVQGEEGGNHDK